MRRDEFESILEVLREFERSDLELALSGNERQVGLIREEYEEACLTFHRKLARLRESAVGIAEERRRLTGTEIPYARQEFRLLGNGSPAAKLLLATKLRRLADKVDVLDERLEAKVRQIRLSARSLVYLEKSVNGVGEGYALIEMSLAVLDFMEANGIDPGDVRLADRRKLEVAFEVD